MAPLKVIGASLGRCGTDSMRVALDILGYNTHHMKSFVEDPTLSCDEFYEACLNQDQADWDKLYRNYDAATDFPAATFYKSLLAKYPDAKVLLTVRSADSWYNSVKKTISRVAIERPITDSNHPYYPFRRLATAVCLDGWIQNPEKFADEKHVKKLFNDHIEEVQRVVPADQLLVMQLGEGWERLCKFLGKEIPNVPYPSVNSAADFERYFIKGEGTANLEEKTVRGLSVQ